MAPSRASRRRINNSALPALSGTRHGGAPPQQHACRPGGACPLRAAAAAGPRHAPVANSDLFGVVGLGAGAPGLPRDHGMLPTHSWGVGVFQTGGAESGGCHCWEGGNLPRELGRSPGRCCMEQSSCRRTCRAGTPGAGSRAQGLPAGPRSRAQIPATCLGEATPTPALQLFGGPIWTPASVCLSWGPTMGPH